MRERSPLNTKSGAEAFELHLRQVVSERGSVEAARKAKKFKSKEKPIGFAEFTERWLKEYVDVNNGLSERYNKRKSLRGRLLPFFGRMRLDEIDQNSVECFKAKLVEFSLNPKTINNHLTILNKCLSTARDWSIIASVPKIKLLKTARPPFRFLSPLETELLLASIKAPILRTMVRTAVRAGLRYSELRALHWEDIDCDRQLITVQRAYILKQIGPTKNYRTRYIPMSPDLLIELQQLPHSSHLVFPVREKHSRQLELLKRECRQAAIPSVGWHALRHTFASHMMTAGAPIHAVQSLLGHSSIEMTMRYSHLTPNDLRSTIALLNKSQGFRATCRQPEPVSSPVEGIKAAEALPFLASA